MGELDIIGNLITTSPVAGVLLYWVISLKKELKEAKTANAEYANDYKQMSENAIKIITLTEDKLGRDQGSNEKIRDIHRMVGEILEIEKRREAKGSH